MLCFHPGVVDRSKIDHALRHIDDVIHESERIRESVERQLRRRALWPERGAEEESPPRSPDDERRPAPQPHRHPRG
jgi:hypothetical protein